MYPRAEEEVGNAEVVVGGRRTYPTEYSEIATEDSHLIGINQE